MNQGPPKRAECSGAGVRWRGSKARRRQGAAGQHLLGHGICEDPEGMGSASQDRLDSLHC